MEVARRRLPLRGPAVGPASWPLAGSAGTPLSCGLSRRCSSSAVHSASAIQQPDANEGKSILGVNTQFQPHAVIAITYCKAGAGFWKPGTTELLVWKPCAAELLVCFIEQEVPRLIEVTIIKGVLCHAPGASYVILPQRAPLGL